VLERFGAVPPLVGGRRLRFESVVERFAGAVSCSGLGIPTGGMVNSRTAAGKCKSRLIYLMRIHATRSRVARQ